MLLLGDLCKITNEFGVLEMVLGWDKDMHMLCQGYRYNAVEIIPVCFP